MVAVSSGSGLGIFGSSVAALGGVGGTLVTETYGAGGNNLTASHVVSNGVTQTLTTYASDNDDRLVEVRVDLTPMIANDALSYPSTYTYDGASDRIASISQSDGTSVQFDYLLVDAEYRVHTYTDAAGRVTTFNYTSLRDFAVDAWLDINEAVVSGAVGAVIDLFRREARSTRMLNLLRFQNLNVSAGVFVPDKWVADMNAT